MKNISSTKKSHFTLYYALLGSFIKKGRKIKAKKSLDLVFLKLSLFFKKPFHIILIRIFVILNSHIETNPVRYRRNSFMVPSPLILKRRIHLVAKRIVNIFKKTKSKISLSNKLLRYILILLKQQNTSTILSLKTTNESLALINRSNIHYRW
jgi:hypothetical protein